ncbi:ATP-grasp domain-containing protein [Flagellimonas meridianipacifica]|uniref:Putative ATP-grasp superfamily ATP-dependent carboligase n=1 Tax=Flagellimonas meridianipacifica TaxID=1080225 RepID=A0A2T0MBY5_9FLAO|nr:ATP-grasp domain-containing protein [Allomuricauda pacifica]PRX55014.1 putative ATP-grasp superfamily ATP-dependent carboligase [Allomuricauda pacifica]
MSKTKRISILIPDAEEGLFVHVFNCLITMDGLDIHIVSKNKTHPFQYSKYVKSFTSFSSELGNEAFLAFINNLCHSKGIDLLFPIMPPMIDFILEYSHRFIETVGLPLLPQKWSLEVVNDKIVFSEHLQSKNIPGPAFQTFKLPLSQDNLKLSFPILIKPHQGKESGSGQGIMLIYDIEEFNDLIPSLGEDGKTVFIQEYIKGFDIDCSVLCKEGEILQHTIQRGVLPGKTSFSPHDGVILEHNEGVLEVTKALMKSLNWTGVAHVDLRFDEKQLGYKVIEVNGRFWQSILASLYVGVNFPQLLVLSAFGKKIKNAEYDTKTFYNRSGALKLIRRNPGILFNLRKLWSSTPLKFVFYDPIPWIVVAKRTIYGRLFG